LLYIENEFVIDQYVSSTKIKNDGLLEYPTISENLPHCFQGFDCLYLKNKGFWRNLLHLKRGNCRAGAARICIMVKMDDIVEKEI